MRKRLREMPGKAALDIIYAKPHQHRAWLDHRIRVDVTTAIARHMVRQGGTVADLSCGDATIAGALEKSNGVMTILGDYAPGYEFTGPIERTIHEVDERIDLFVCSETVEHLDDPDAVLAAIRQKADKLILSTPDGEDNDYNPEHVWGWDCEAVADMLKAAGWCPAVHTTLDLRPAGYVYSYQIWGCI